MGKTPSSLYFPALVCFLAALLMPGTAQSAAEPTAPPPPVGPSSTPHPSSTPLPRETEPPARATSTPSLGGPWHTSTPSATPTLDATATLTPTLTPTPTATPVITFLRVQVYLDANGDSQFNTAEGVESLWVSASGEGWSAGALTVDGEATFILADYPPGGKIAVQLPYLHQTHLVDAPKQFGETAALVVRLKLPRFPAFLP